ncbi:MAG: hypothetical protein GF388_03730 [Candidatus Aegiribacteria sp.]|nr:hypothetical protein [Candidatus Aegiribacteria sp.]MBD3294364.1 hypothetical protein [Candidatus Fermentibacteria bacterium]
MVTGLLLLVLALGKPEVSVDIPDTVETDSPFQCTIVVQGENLSGIDCTPVYSGGLIFRGRSSMQSFSSVTTPTGTAVSSTFTLILSFQAMGPGDHTIGPLSITSSGRVLHETGEYTVTSVGEQQAVSAATDITGRSSNEIAWMEVEIDTTGRIYPGEAFTVDYYIYKSLRTADIVDLLLEPADYATSSMVSDLEEIQWTRHKNGVYRALLATLEITPAFACTLSLPVLSGRMGVPGMMMGSREYAVSSEGARIPVYPFPDENRPSNFNGITGALRFSCRRVTRGYSSGGERCVRITAEGRGASLIRQIPVTVQGPAEPLVGTPVQLSDSSRAWNVHLIPSDSGQVVTGPDSVAWFDTEAEEYRQAVIPACTLRVYPSPRNEAEIPSLKSGNSDSTMIWLIVVLVLLTAIVTLILLYRKRSAAEKLSISEAGDAEELLTAVENVLSTILTGSRKWMGSEELDVALEEKGIDTILSRRILRHWKDLELLLSGRQITDEKLEELKRTSLEVVHELKRELRRASGK